MKNLPEVGDIVIVKEKRTKAGLTWTDEMNSWIDHRWKITETSPREGIFGQKQDRLYLQGPCECCNEEHKAREGRVPPHDGWFFLLESLEIHHSQNEEPPKNELEDLIF